jgi:hypothetical protein
MRRLSLLRTFALPGLALLPGLLLAHGEALPLGDNRLASEPRAGWLFGCQRHYNPWAGGARGDVPWIRDGYWYPREKPVVDGNVNWPDASLTITREGASRVVRTNDLPSHPTGIFPIGPDDDAYQWDRNPNSIRAQQVVLTLPAEPALAASPTCVGGEVGFLLTGVLMFNAVDAQGRDAVAHETQDRCNGHPQRSGMYHYHGPSDCMTDVAGRLGRHSDLVGYAFDGFGIYGLFGENGRELKSADLDACHGHTHAVSWDGKTRAIYHYHLTRDFPYSVGCYRGTPVVRGPLDGGMGGGGMQGGRQGPGGGAGWGPPPPHDGRRPPPPPGYGPPPRW